MDEWIEEFSKKFDKYFEQALMRMFRKQEKQKKWKRNNGKRT